LIRSIDDIPQETVSRLFEGDPVNHLFLMQDVARDRERTELFFDDETDSYLLAWYGNRNYTTVALRGKNPPVRYLKSIRRGEKGILLWTKDASLAPEGYSRTEDLFEMVADKNSFSPQFVSETKRLGPEHANAFVSVEAGAGLANVSEEQAIDLLRKQKFYGVFSDGKLVSVAGTHFLHYAMWFVGWVSTLPPFRGRGYAKSATSSVTLEAINSGARSMLRVNVQNHPAIRAYDKIGYRSLGREHYYYYED
jgi:ribosomal protein S18 acetylase RimI-like enzyme